MRYALALAVIYLTLGTLTAAGLLGLAILDRRGRRRAARFDTHADQALAVAAPDHDIDPHLASHVALWVDIAHADHDRYLETRVLPGEEATSC